MENTIEMKKESWIMTILAYPFRLIAEILSALSMDDKGWSLKKILSTFSTYKAAQFTEAHLTKENTIILVVIWIAYAGILVGIYSIGDITDAISKVKGTNQGTTNCVDKENKAI